MSATMQQFIAEVSPRLKILYQLHINSRADYKQAVEDWSVTKMPQATEDVRRKFVTFALSCYDLMKKSGFEPNASLPQMGQKLQSIIEGN